MTDKNISELQTAAEVALTDYMHLRQGGIDRKATVEQVKDKVLEDLANDTDPSKGASLVGRAIGQISIYASVRGLTESGIATQIYVGGRLSLFDGAHGMFQLDPLDTTTPDDDGTVLVDAAGRRWKRQFSGSPQLEWWGTGTDADYSANVQRALDTGKVCEFSTPIKISSDVWIKSGGGIVGVGDGAVITLDNGARIRAEKGAGFRAFDATAQYWNEILPPSTPLSQNGSSMSTRKPKPKHK